MTEQTGSTPAGASAAIDDDWLAATPTEQLSADHDPTTSTPRRLLAMRAGLVAAGAVIGGVVVATVAHGGSTSTANGVPRAVAGQLPGNGQLPANGQLPGGGQFPGRPGGPGGAGGPGGLAAEQHLAGTLVSVGSSAVTVKTSSGTATYAVTGASEIVRNGRVAALSALQPGDSVFVHVYPSGAGSRLAVERLLATSSTSAGTHT